MILLILLLWVIGGSVIFNVSFYMPGFFKDMPKQDDKYYYACVIKINLFKENKEIYCSQAMRGLRTTYIWARLIALYYDLFVIPNGEGLGVNWAVKGYEL